MKYSGLNVIFLCVFVAMFVGSLFLIRAQFNVGEVARPDIVISSGNESPLVPVALAEYVNVRGEKWKIARGTYDFEVSAAADTYPQFVSGILDPLDVQPGDIQKMRLVINDTGALTEVYAEIGHDNGKDIVPLKLVSAGAVSRADQFKKDFFFDETGVLTTREEWVAIHPDNSASLVASAAAQSVRQYVYEGEWLVHDTHRAIYRTTFLIKSETGKTNSLTLAWSDPFCDIATTTTPWTLRAPCSLTSVSAVDGIDGFNLDLNGQTITISNGATFAYSPGYSITKIPSGGGILVGGSPKGKVQKQYVYYRDADSDGFATSTAITLSSSPSMIGFIRMKDSPGADKRDLTRAKGNWDCYENPGDLAVSQRSRPGQPQFFFDRSLKPDYDFNCDGVSTPTFSTNNVPTGTLVPNLCGYRGTVALWSLDDLALLEGDCGGDYSAMSGSCTCSGNCAIGNCGGGGGGGAGFEFKLPEKIVGAGWLEKVKNIIAPSASAIPWVPMYGFRTSDNTSCYGTRVYSLCR